DISFSPGMNIICGPNGIGKTTILECIAQSFTYNPLSYIRKKANRDSGSWKLSTTKGDIYNIERKNFHPSDDNGLNSLTGSQFARDIIYIKTQRSFDYITLKNISNDERATSDMRMLSEGINITDAKNWFVSRHLWSAHSDSLEDAQRHNLEIAKSIFEKTDPDTHFSRVKGGSNDILLKQQDGTEIYFEYLSSGYKSIIFILLGLIKEIEHRYVNENLTVEKFEGVILIDELDLHLHPQWQANLLSVLIDIFPNAQFITS
ncbi:AAA family ATPase, partial [Clostridioides difficile]